MAVTGISRCRPPGEAWLRRSQPLVNHRGPSITIQHDGGRCLLDVRTDADRELGIGDPVRASRRQITELTEETVRGSPAMRTIAGRLVRKSLGGPRPPRRQLAEVHSPAAFNTLA